MLQITNIAWYELTVTHAYPLHKSDQVQRNGMSKHKVCAFLHTEVPSARETGLCCARLALPQSIVKNRSQAASSAHLRQQCC
jgi:hypothetical protein